MGPQEFDGRGLVFDAAMIRFDFTTQGPLGGARFVVTLPAARDALLHRRLLVGLLRHASPVVYLQAAGTAGSGHGRSR